MTALEEGSGEAIQARWDRLPLEARQAAIAFARALARRDVELMLRGEDLGILEDSKVEMSGPSKRKGKPGCPDFP